MNLFELSHSDWDEYSHWLFVHPVKSHDTFNEDCEFLLKNYFNDFMQDEENTRGFIGMRDLVELIADKLPTLGYQEATKVIFSLNGSGIIQEKDSEYKHLIKLIGHDNAKTIAKHNDAVYERLLAK